MFDIKIDEGLLARLPKMNTDPAMAAELRRVMDEQDQYTVGHIMEAYLSFPASNPPTMEGLRAVTNRLRGNLRAVPAETTAGGVTGGVSNNVEYARIHEFGGQTRAHDIVARNGKMLCFKGGDGKLIFRKLIHHPGSNMPARAPMQRGIEDRLEYYMTAFAEAIPRILNN